MPENNDNNKPPQLPQKSKIEPLEDWDLDNGNSDSIGKHIDSLDDIDDLDDLLDSQKRGIRDADIDSLNLPDEDDVLASLEEAHSAAEDEARSELTDEELLELQNRERLERDERNRGTQSKKKKTSMTEMVAIVCCLLLIIGLGVYCYQYFNNQFDIKTEEDWVSNIPTSGEYASIESLDTGWSPPLKRRVGVKLVPTITLTLAPESTSGYLKINFYSDEKGLNNFLKPKGDPIDLKFENGKFTQNGANSITVQGTDGFRELGLFYAYKAQVEKRWTVGIEESPLDSPSSHKELAHAPITPNRAEVTIAK